MPRIIRCKHPRVPRRNDTGRIQECTPPPELVRVTVDRNAMKRGANVPPIVIRRDDDLALVATCWELDIMGPSRLVFDPVNLARNGNKKLWIEAPFNALRYEDAS